MKSVLRVTVFIALSGLASIATAADSAKTSSAGWPRVTNAVGRDAQQEARIAELVGKLTLEQKVAQMVQPDIRNVTPDEVRKYRIGSVLNGGGAWPGNKKTATIAEWVSLADAFYDASMDASTGAPAIPIIWGTDAVHGHNNVIGATLFPHNIGLGAAHDPDLVGRIGATTAREVAVTGIDWVFAPTVAVVRDDRWGRAYEGYSEDPEIVRTYASSMVRGLQGVAGTPSFINGNRVVATAKHYIGDGGTYLGIDHGDNCSTESELLRIHGQGYIGAIEAGVQTVMASYNSWQGTKVHGHRYLLTEVLKGRLGFDGLVVSDWDGIDEVQGCSKARCAQAVNAGIDLFMVPEDWKAFIWNTVAQVRAGDIPETRIDDAVTRILRVKMRAGLFGKGRPSARLLSNQGRLIGAPEHRAIAREAVRKSLVLLKNENDLLPLRRKLNVLVAGDGADDIGKQSGGWTLTWQGTGNSNADFPGATSIYAGIRAAVESAGGKATLSVDGSFQSKPDVAIVVFGEHPYAEWQGDIPVLDRATKYRTDPAPAPEASAVNATCKDLTQTQPPSSPAALTRDPVLPTPTPTQNQALAATPALTQNQALLAPPSAPTVRGADDGATHVTVNRELTLLETLKQKAIPTVAIFLTGRPLFITPELESSTAFVVAWLPGTEGGGVSDILFRKPTGQTNFNFTGKLSYSWPKSPTAAPVNRGDLTDTSLFPYGYGLTYGKGGKL